MSLTGRTSAQQLRTDRRGPDRGESFAEFGSGRVLARAWGKSIPERRRQQAAWSFIKVAIDEYVAEAIDAGSVGLQATMPSIALTFSLDRTATDLARVVGRESARLPVTQACYQLSATYAALVPSDIRSALGMYYTPPVLTERLLDMAEAAGVDWSTTRVLDPACGGGAFLLPVALRMRKALGHLPAADALAVIARRLRGFEIDPFAAWLTQTWVGFALFDLIATARRPLPPLVQVADMLDQQICDEPYDLVIGNPPYGRVSLTSEQRRRFKRSLYGHANLYGVFTDIAMRWAKPAGIIAYVTPTSFLAGEYFKALRSLIAAEAPPIAVDFLEARRGVFEDVLQEALLATYRKAGSGGRTAVHYLAISSEMSGKVTHAGHFNLPACPAAPWLAQRMPEHQALIDRLAHMPHRLADWGYQVSTGPLVWNRFKSQLQSHPGKNAFPLIWAEAVTSDGRFIFRAEKRDHEPYFRVEKGDEWLKVDVPCVLVQRTTAKEQARRLISAEMPASFIAKHDAVVVENHLNMIRPLPRTRPKVSAAVLSVLLNSSIVDDAFRCISGSVAVSAFELEALPLPPPARLRAVDTLIRLRTSRETMDAAIRALYLGET
jgi:adenine-specific DNA-methyltransferase